MYFIQSRQVKFHEKRSFTKFHISEKSFNFVQELESIVQDRRASVSIHDTSLVPENEILPVVKGTCENNEASRRSTTQDPSVVLHRKMLMCTKVLLSDSVIDIHPVKSSEIEIDETCGENVEESSVSHDDMPEQRPADSEDLSPRPKDEKNTRHTAHDDNLIDQDHQISTPAKQSKPTSTNTSHQKTSIHCARRTSVSSDDRRRETQQLFPSRESMLCITNVSGSPNVEQASETGGTAHHDRIEVRVLHDRIEDLEEECRVLKRDLEVAQKEREAAMENLANTRVEGSKEGNEQFSTNKKKSGCSAKDEVEKGTTTNVPESKDEQISSQGKSSSSSESSGAVPDANKNAVTGGSTSRTPEKQSESSVQELSTDFQEQDHPHISAEPPTITNTPIKTSNIDSPDDKALPKQRPSSIQTPSSSLVVIKELRLKNQRLEKKYSKILAAAMDHQKTLEQQLRLLQTDYENVAQELVEVRKTLAEKAEGAEQAAQRREEEYRKGLEEKELELEEKMREVQDLEEKIAIVLKRQENPDENIAIRQSEGYKEVSEAHATTTRESKTHLPSGTPEETTSAENPVLSEKDSSGATKNTNKIQILKALQELLQSAENFVSASIEDESSYTEIEAEVAMHEKLHQTLVGLFREHKFGGSKMQLVGGAKHDRSAPSATISNEREEDDERSDADNEDNSGMRRAEMIQESQDTNSKSQNNIGANNHNVPPDVKSVTTNITSTTNAIVAPEHSDLPQRYQVLQKLHGNLMQDHAVELAKLNRRNDNLRKLLLKTCQKFNIKRNDLLSDFMGNTLVGRATEEYLGMNKENTAPSAKNGLHQKDPIHLPR